MDVVQTSFSTPPRVGNDPNSAASNNGLTSTGRTIRAVAIAGIVTMALTGVGELSRLPFFRQAQAVRL